MSEAKCSKCGGSATGDTYDIARSNINHAVGMSRGIKCGDSYGCVTEVNPSPKPEIPKQTTQIQKPIETEIPKDDSPVTKSEKQSTAKKSKKEKYL